MLPIIPAIPVIVLLIAAAALNLSLAAYQVIRNTRKSLQERLEELETLLRKGRITREEYDRARALMLEKYAR